MTGRSSVLSRAITLLVGLGIALQAFGAIYRPEALGFLAASPGVLLLLLATILSLPHALGHVVTLRSWLLIGWGVVASLVSAMVFGWHPLYASKLVPLLILSVVWMAPLLCLRALDAGMLRIAVGAGLGITLIGYLISDLIPGILSGALRGLIFGGGYEVYFDSRPRAFMTETSHFAAIFGRYGLILVLLLEVGRRYSGPRLMASVGLVTAGLLITESKGAALSMAATLILMSASRRGLPYFLLLVPGAWFLVDSQFEAISFDIGNFTSTSTRVGLWLAGVAAMLANPAGWGYYGFYGAVERFGTWSMDQLSELPLLFTELQNIVGELTSVSFKSTLLDFGVVFGLPFWFFLANVLRRIDLTDPRVRCALAYFALSGATTAGHESIAFFLGLAVLVRFYPRCSSAVAPVASHLKRRWHPPMKHSAQTI